MLDYERCVHAGVGHGCLLAVTRAEQEVHIVRLDNVLGDWEELCFGW